METTKDCYIGNQKVDCPETETISNTAIEKLDLLPPNSSLEIRNDLLFGAIVLTVVAGLCISAIAKIKVFGMTLIEYLKPIWYFVLIAIATVFWQYLVGINLEASALQLRVSQWVWQGMVALSAYKLSKIPAFSYPNIFFLGILYSILIHGFKVSIRYFFYAKSLWYVADRFLYGSLLVMLIAVIFGSVFIYLRNK